jgi:hypothetical protein
MFGVISVLAIWLMIAWRMRIEINRRYPEALERDQKEANRERDAESVDEKKAVAVDRVVQPYELEEQRGTTGLA